MDKSQRLPPAILLMGPTAAGKTDLAMALCDRLPCEIISVDSTLVYRGMDIGTAKPSAAQLARYPHRLIDIRDPAEPYSAATFRDDALREMQDITAKGNIPLLVGGTMLYFKILVQGMSDLPPADEEARQTINAMAAKQGWPEIHRQLAAVDPQSASRINPNDPQRLQRALEVHRLTGISMTEWRQREKNNTQQIPYRLFQLAIAASDRALLHQRIEQRFDRMLEEGFVEEVRRLQQRPDMHVGLPAIRAVGYRQVWDYLAGELSFNEMRERGVIATRQLAKRQFTWLRSWQDLHWLMMDYPLEGSANDRAPLKTLDQLLAESLLYLDGIDVAV